MGPKNVNKKNMNEFYGRLTKSHAFLKVCSIYLSIYLLILSRSISDHHLRCGVDG